MRTYELLCVLFGEMNTPVDAQTQHVCVAGYTAVLSSKPRPAITLPKSRQTALHQAADRQALYESLLAQGGVLPAKPDQWLSQEQAYGFLSANTPVFKELHDWLYNKVQFQVAVSWPSEQVLAHFRDSPELSPLFGSASVTTPMLEQAVARLRSRLSGQIRQGLSAVATNMVSLPVIEDMVCNTAVLVPREAEHLLDQAVENVDAIWSDGFRIKQIGPSAPGSFALLELAWIEEQNIRDAFATLSLPPAAHQEEHRAARRAALMLRPAEAEAIKRAADIVTAAALAPQTGFHLVRILSEETAISDDIVTAVA